MRPFHANIYWQHFFSLFLLIPCLACQTKQPIQQPNFVFILIDDLGWNDLTCYGSSFYETPNIDQLAAEGMRFTDAYAACPVCSPTRASILTGQYPARLNITDWIPGSDPKDQPLLGTKDQHELPLHEVTIAEALKEAGYSTAFFGKWHLGEAGYYPEDQGFDINKGGHWAGQPASYFYPYKNDRKRWDVPNLAGGKTDEYLTDRLTAESIAFMQQQQDQPFLLYLSHYAVHTPIQSKPALEEKYQEKAATLPVLDTVAYSIERSSITKQRQDNPAYAGMIESVDESIGQIMAYLKEAGLSENTIIFFTSDNGGLSTLPNNRKSPTAVTPLRAGKGWLYEGGIRIPLIVKWEHKIPANSVSKVPVISTDFFPTILEMADLPLRPTVHTDGKSLMPLLIDREDQLERAALYWHFPHYHGSGNKPSAAIRFNDYKLIKWYESDSTELYHLSDDIEEREELSNLLPATKDALEQLLINWQKDIGALFPKENPEFE